MTSQEKLVKELKKQIEERNKMTRNDLNYWISLLKASLIVTGLWLGFCLFILWRTL